MRRGSDQASTETVNTLESPNFLLMRANPEMRSDFLERLCAENRALIRHAAKGKCSATFGYDDAEQLFLLGANAAIDTARTEDDGRGRNDPEAWCQYKAMLAVREGLRNIIGRRYPRPISVPYKYEEKSMRYADPNDYADEACANLSITDLLRTLNPIDREAAMLLIFGAGDYAELVCRCVKGTHHSYIYDLALALDCSEGRVFKIIRRLRNAVGHMTRAA